MTGPPAETALATQLASIRERVALPPGADHEWRWAAGRLLWACDELERLDAAAHAMLNEYGVPHCGDVVHRINELGQSLRRAMRALERQ